MLVMEMLIREDEKLDKFILDDWDNWVLRFCFVFYWFCGLLIFCHLPVTS